MLELGTGKLGEAMVQLQLQQQHLLLHLHLSTEFLQSTQAPTDSLLTPLVWSVDLAVKLQGMR
jgi:hypothetical protein